MKGFPDRLCRIVTQFNVLETGIFFSTLNTGCIKTKLLTCWASNVKKKWIHSEHILLRIQSITFHPKRNFSDESLILKNMM